MAFSSRADTDLSVVVPREIGGTVRLLVIEGYLTVLRNRLGWTRAQDLDLFRVRSPSAIQESCTARGAVLLGSEQAAAWLR